MNAVDYLYERHPKQDDAGAFQSFVQMAQAVRELGTALTPEVIEFLRLSQHADTSILPIKGDKLITMGEAASVLDVNTTTISRFVREGLLHAYYTPHSRMRKFWLSDVKALARGECDEGDF